MSDNSISFISVLPSPPVMSSPEAFFLSDMAD
jgi:hypothetical protein